MKVEAIHPTAYETFEHVATELPQGIDQAYNETGLHSALGCLSSRPFEELHVWPLVKTAA